jgi:hypothetical protein
MKVVKEMKILEKRGREDRQEDRGGERSEKRRMKGREERDEFGREV